MQKWATRKQIKIIPQNASFSSDWHLNDRRRMVVVQWSWVYSTGCARLCFQIAFFLSVPNCIIFEHYLQNDLFRTKAVISPQWPIGLVGSSKASCHIWGTGNSDLRSSTLLCCFYCAMLFYAVLLHLPPVEVLCCHCVVRDRIKVIEVFCQVICRTVNWVGLGGIQHE